MNTMEEISQTRSCTEILANSARVL